MKTNISNIIGKSLTAIFSVLLMTAFASCTGNEDNNGGELKPTTGRAVTLEMVQQRQALHNVLSALAGVTVNDTLGIDFERQTYKPVIGVEYFDEDPGQRVVEVYNENDAELQFCSLVGGSHDLVKETADGYMIDLTHLDCRQDGKVQNLGTLTFHRSTDEMTAGYADVDIACIPTLKRIVYLPTGIFNGWSGSGWESPCLVGQVWQKRGNYYLCVIESTPYSDGWLINVQPGRGNMYSIVAENEKNKGAWTPQNVVSRDAVQAFVYFCIDAQFYDMKQAIIRRYPGKVIPFVPIAHGKGQDCSWDHYTNPDDGFGTKRQGYAHWVGGDSELGPMYDAPGDGPEVLIVRNGWIGDYAWIPARSYRNMEMFCMAPRHGTKSLSYWWTNTYVYTRFEDEDFCDWLAQKYPYTANGFSFRDAPPSGFGNSPVYDPAD